MVNAGDGNTLYRSGSITPSELLLTKRLVLSYCPKYFAAKPGLELNVGGEVSPVSFVIGFFALRLERRLRMGTKPMVFPLDYGGRLYALYDENDNQICTGSRETCYRLLELMLRTKKPTEEEEQQPLDVPEQTLQAAMGGISLMK